MKKRVLVLCVLAAALALTATVAAATAQTLRLTSVSESEKETANGFTFTEKIYRGGKLVGRDKAICVFEQNVANCKITITLPEGKIVIRAKIPGDSNQGKLTVLSGTGDYAGATGGGTFKNVSETKTKITINLN